MRRGREIYAPFYDNTSTFFIYIYYHEAIKTYNNVLTIHACLFAKERRIY